MEQEKTNQDKIFNVERQLDELQKQFGKFQNSYDLEFERIKSNRDIELERIKYEKQLEEREKIEKIETDRRIALERERQESQRLENERKVDLEREKQKTLNLESEAKLAVEKEKQETVRLEFEKQKIVQNEKSDKRKHVLISGTLVGVGIFAFALILYSYFQGNIFNQ